MFASSTRASRTASSRTVAELAHDVPRLIRELRKLRKSGELRCCYEAGPTGFGLHWALREAGIACEVITPSLIPTQVGSRVKTDTDIASLVESWALKPLVRAAPFAFVCASKGDRS